MYMYIRLEVTNNNNVTIVVTTATTVPYQSRVQISFAPHHHSLVVRLGASSVISTRWSAQTCARRVVPWGVVCGAYKVAVQVQLAKQL
jgi:hypothetical protein